jgi:hypothetical protein
MGLLHLKVRNDTEKILPPRGKTVGVKRAEHNVFINDILQKIPIFI